MAAKCRRMVARSFLGKTTSLLLQSNRVMESSEKSRGILHRKFENDFKMNVLSGGLQGGERLPSDASQSARCFSVI